MKEKPCMETWYSIDVCEGSENAYEGGQKWPLSFLSVCMWIRTYLVVVIPYLAQASSILIHFQ